MAKELMGAVVSRGKIEATYRYSIAGALKTDRKEKGWPAEVLAAGEALIDAAQDVAEDAGNVGGVQIYTAITDPAGTPFSGPGELVDINFVPGNSPQAVRIGDDEAVPAALASARAALVSAIEAAL
jgi:hypothetical protein